MALDDPQPQRILFRDADSSISRREAAAVQQAGQQQALSQDARWNSHTELMMAGLWDVVASSLPPLNELIERFMSAPLQSQHFANQYFLRRYIWPYACTSIMQHDSVLGFMDTAPFPNGKARDELNIGFRENFTSIAIKLYVRFSNTRRTSVYLPYPSNYIDSKYTDKNLEAFYEPFKAATQGG